MSALSVREVTVAFESVRVFDRLSLEIEEGEFLVLLGPSGCGKSTLLDAIAGLLEVERGQIWIDGKNVTWEEPKDRGIAMVFQSQALYPRMSVRENLSFGLRMAKMPRPKIARRVRQAAQILQIEQLLDRRAGSALGRAAAARRDRPGARPRRRGVPVRRAALQPRRATAQRAARRDQAAAPAARPDDDGRRHPRPDRGVDAGPSGSPRCTSRTSHRPGRTRTRTAGATSAAARSTGRGC